MVLLSKKGASKAAIAAIVVVIVIIVAVGVGLMVMQKPEEEQPPGPGPGPGPAAPTKAFHKRVIYIINDDETARITLFQTGTGDVAAIPMERLQDVEGLTMDGFESVVQTGIPEPAMVFIVLNTQVEPFDNPVVRQALAWAVPYDQIIQVVYAGHLIRNHGVIPIGWPGYTEYNTYMYEYDIDKAKQLLEDAGIDLSNYTISIMYNAGNTQRERIATLLQSTWGELGFQEVRVEAFEWPVVLDKGEHGDFYAWLIGWLPDYLDSDNYAGPFLYGATKFSDLDVHVDVSASDIPSLLSSGEVIDAEDALIVVGEKGTGFSPEVGEGKEIIVVAYTVDEEATKPVEYYMEEGLGFGPINPAFLRDTNLDALIVAARYEARADVRAKLYEAVFIKSNHLVPEIILGQYELARVYWNWLQGRYWHPTFPERFDLIWEDPDAPAVPIGIGDYQNDNETLVEVTIGWPESFDPAMTYETFGWEIWHQIGDTLVTYWKEETEEVTPDLAVAWAHSEDATDWYFVIRGGVVAYDPWNEKTYPIDAVDMVFTIWRVSRLGHSVSWMVDEFINVSALEALTEEEFDQLLQSTPLVAEYRGQSTTVSSLQELLDFFGYSGETAGVVHIKLYSPYSPILGILTDSFLSVVSMRYLLGDNYQAALEASNYGKNVTAWENYVTDLGEQDPTHQQMHRYPVGTGPYYVKEYEENSYIVLEANPYYWNATLWQELYGYTPS